MPTKMGNGIFKNLKKRELTSLLIILLISLCATSAGLILNQLNTEVNMITQVEETQQEWVEWMKREHFRMIESDVAMVLKAFEAWTQAWELSYEYLRLQENKTEYLNHTYASKIIYELETYELYLRSTNIYRLDNILSYGNNATLSRLGDFLFTINQKDWLEFNPERRISLVKYTPFSQLIDNSQDFKVGYIFQGNDTFNSIIFVTLLNVWGERFDDSTQGILKTTSWENRSVLKPHDYYDFNMLLYEVIQKKNGEFITASQNAQRTTAIRDFVAIFVSITTVGTMLAAAMSSRKDNKRNIQSFDKIRRLLKDEEKEMDFKPDNSSTIILMLTALISLGALVLILMNYLSL